MRTANLAIVFTDIKGFTERTSRQTLEQNRALLAAHEQVLAPVFKAFGGRIIKTIGDAFLVTFESPTNAVLSGVALQDRLWVYNQTATAETRLDVRVAINVGEVRLDSGDVFGEPVNIAARVEGLADGGEVYFTEAVYLVMNKAEVPAEEVGLFDLKGIPGKVRIYKVPKAPHRIAATPVPGTPLSADGEHAPPYGNLGLMKMPEGTRLPEVSPALLAAGELSGRAMKATGQALHQGSVLVQKAYDELKQQAPGALGRFKRLPGKQLVVAAALSLVALTALLLFTRGSAVERAIEQVGSASSAEKPKKLSEARRLIDLEKEAPRREWLQGRLAEVQNETGAANRYQDAAEHGYGKAESSLIDLLGHERCALRAAAANSLGDLKLQRARSALERLADKGGPGDGTGGVFGIGGCDSKRAAERALKELP